MRQPSLQEGVNGYIDYALNNVYTSIPAVVVNVHNSFNDQRIDVQPSINTKYKNGSSKEHPTILHVPVIMPSSSTSAILFPLNVGDTVLLVFSQRGLDVFKSGNGLPSTPTDFRKFDKRDAFAIPGAVPFAKAPNNPAKHTNTHSTSDMVVVHNLGTAEECEIRLKQSGDINITTSANVNVNTAIANITATTTNIVSDVNITGDVNINGNVETTGTLKNNSVNVGSTHVHGGVLTGPGSTSTPS